GGFACGRETHSGGWAGAWRGRYAQPAPATADGEAIPGTPAGQVDRLLFFPRDRRPLSCERASSAGYACRERPAASGAHPDARITTPAADATKAGRGPPGSGPDYRINRLRQELDARSADRPRQQRAARSHRD